MKLNRLLLTCGGLFLLAAALYAPSRTNPVHETKVVLSEETTSSSSRIPASTNQNLSAEADLDEPLPQQEKFRPPFDVALMKKFIQSDDLCGYMQYLNGSSSPVVSENPDDWKNAREAMMETLQLTDPCDLALTSETAQEALSWAKQSNALTCRFTIALLLGKMLPMSHPDKDLQKPDYAEAEKILTALQSEFPQNGIYSFFLLPLLEKRGASQEELTAMARKLAATEDFKNPISLSMLNIYRLGMTTGTRLITAVSILSTMQIPDYGPSQTVLRRLLEDQPELASVLQPWAIRMSEELAFFSRTEASEPYVILIELAVLRALALKVWKAAEGESSPPPRSLSENAWKDLSHSIRDRSYGGRIGDLIMKAQSEKTHLCDPASKKEMAEIFKDARAEWSRRF